MGFSFKTLSGLGLYDFHVVGQGALGHWALELQALMVEAVATLSKNILLGPKVGSDRWPLPLFSHIANWSLRPKISQ